MKQPVKKILSVIFVGCMLLSAAVMQADAVHTAQNISSDNASVSASSAAQHNTLLQEWNLDTGSRGTDETPRFIMEKGEGFYLRWYCEVPKYSEPVHVYLYDIGKGEIVSAMSPQMNPGEKRQEVFYVGSDSSNCQFRIQIESVTGGTAYATVRANQIAD
ncbi:MAG: hypothetical protein ACLUDG_04860 [Butyricicoccus sp.]